MSDDPAATLLLLLRLKAFAPSEAIASTLAMSPAAVEVQMRRLESRGWVQHRTGMAAGWSLTPEGRRHGQSLVRAELDAAGTRRLVEAGYTDFLPLNAELLSVCTDWQTVVVDGAHVPNDHTDASRDAAVLARLDALHRAVVPVLDRLSAALARFTPYRLRLDLAHSHVRAGRTEWIAKPTIDSYHGVWFELHEHLLVTLDRDRSTEPLPQHAPTHNGESR
jgi:DNA-binding MarR family transcriptional regulator